MTPITELKGVGTQIAQKLEKVKVLSVEDLLFHFPLRYQDRTRVCPIADLRPGDEALIEGVIEDVRIIYRHRRILLIHLRDQSASLSLRFFYFSNAQKNTLHSGKTLRVYGEVRQTTSGFEMIHPEYKFSQAAKAVPGYVPVYPTTEGLHQLSLIKLTNEALHWLTKPDNELEELLPASLKKRWSSLSSLKDAIQYIHRPPPEADIEQLQAGTHPFQKQLCFEEMLAHSLSLRRLRNHSRQQHALPLSETGALFGELQKQLPFTLTTAQQKVIADIQRDLSQPSPMMRLVQGDVGSGKTIVAVAAILAAVEKGVQAAMMAPTEILAEQHYHNLSNWLSPLKIKVCLLTSKQKAQDARMNLRRIRTGEAQVVVGTHALFQSRVDFSNLAMVVIDEQHRFGVHQRLALKQKGEDHQLEPHQLIMTATPIPRSLAMTMYADLDYSVIDEMPPGRLPVKTVAVVDTRRHEIIKRVHTLCTDGYQAYWVCPLIDESEVLPYQTAEQTYQLLSTSLTDITVAILHGRMKPQEKENILDAFKAGKTQILVTTTVIEVGVDVASANLMIIENAERFGLAQLHQLRGRVGRGLEQASCVLIYQPPLSPHAQQRIHVMRTSNDGFQIAYEDMKIRGPGEMLGTRQTGEMQFRIADLIRDGKELEYVIKAADEILDRHPEIIDKLVQRWLGQAARYAEV